jgi:hypothetical protein
MCVETSAPTYVASQAVLHTTKDGAILLESTLTSGQNKNKQSSLPWTSICEETNLTQVGTEEQAAELLVTCISFFQRLNCRTSQSLNCVCETVHAAVEG